MVVDGIIKVIATFNLDPRSTNLSTECTTIIDSERISKNILLGFEEEFKLENAWEPTLDFNPDSEVDWYKRVKIWKRKIFPNNIL